MKVLDVDAAGVRLRVVETGSGAPVLVLHGFTGNADSMQVVAEALERDYRVLRIELVGHGGSDAPDSVAPYTMTACVDQLAAVAAGLAPDGAHLVGYSMGARAALAAAVAHPDRFRRLVLIAATAGISDPLARAERVRADEALAARIEEEGVEAFVDAWMALPLFASQQRLGPAVLARARTQRLANSARGLARSLRGMGAGAQPPVHGRLSEWKAPTLLVVGEEDAKFRRIAGELAAKLADAEICVLEKAGHAAHLEAPEAFGAAVRSFLEKEDES